MAVSVVAVVPGSVVVGSVGSVVVVVTLVVVVVSSAGADAVATAKSRTATPVAMTFLGGTNRTFWTRRRFGFASVRWPCALVQGDRAVRPDGRPAAGIGEIAESIAAGNRFQTILGATGTGKTATMAWTIEKLQRPALVIAHNKTLAAQLCNEFREFFPDNAVEYFVSYYDYFQPEAYIPQADLYIEKDSSQNDDIARLRLSATSSLLTRRDVVVVASVSCIYGLGSPEEWRERVLILAVGETQDRDDMLRKLIESQYVRNDTVLGRGRFRVKRWPTSRSSRRT